MSFAKQPNVAGSFYPQKKSVLQQTIVDLLNDAPLIPLNNSQSLPKAMIVPHAGYIYSGTVAAVAYKPFSKAKHKPNKIILIGPSHFVPFFGIATIKADSFITPLGEIFVDENLVNAALNINGVISQDNAFQKEHCLEVQLPFIQEVLPGCRIAPFLVGNASYQEVANLLKALWGGPETLIIVSSDLSHYHDYATANKLDQVTSMAIEQLAIDKMADNSACGKLPIQGLLQCAIDFGLKVTKLELKNSGDTFGDKSRVVGYGAYYLY